MMTPKMKEDLCTQILNGSRQLFLSSKISEVCQEKGNIENNCTVLRVISEQSPMENAIKVEPTLEDLYLFYFKGVNE